MNLWRRLGGLVLGLALIGQTQAAFGLEGPFVEFVADRSVRVTWRTAEACRSLLEFGKKGGPLNRYPDEQVVRDHTVTLLVDDPVHIYRFRILEGDAGSEGRTNGFYEFDSALNYLPIRTTSGSSIYPAGELTGLYQATASNILEQTNCRRGYCLVAGGGEGQLAFEIARQTEMQVIIVEEDPRQAAKVRQALRKAGVYGQKVTVRQGRLDAVPFAPNLFNLILSDSMLRTGQFPASAAVLHQLLRPYGGVLCLGQWERPGPRRFTRAELESWLREADFSSGQTRVTDNDGLFWVYRRGEIPGAGSWTHQYGSGANTACSDDELVKGDLGIAWWGRPGPRPMPDRGSHSPAPLSCNGRLFVQGDRVLFGLDAYNGTVLWSFQIPGYRRLNMVHDCSNLAASGDRLYLAGGAHCFAIDGQTGNRLRSFPVPTNPGDGPIDWGFVGCQGDLLLGTATPRGAARPFDDSHNWYTDGTKVVSSKLFAVDRETGSARWTYERGLIVNSTITFDQAMVCFIEVRNPPPEARSKGQINGGLAAEQKPYLVVLDLERGRVKWELARDFSDFFHMAYLSLGHSTIVAAGSRGVLQKPHVVPMFHTYAFDAVDGRLLWEQHEGDRKGHHSGWLGHPVLIGDQLCHNMQFVDLRSGKVLREDNDFAWHGCGTASASRHAVFRRYQHLGMWDVETGRHQELFSVRSSCWLNAISAGGLLLVPEASSGCTCSAYALQTSVGFAPRPATVRFASGTRDFMDSFAVELLQATPKGVLRYTRDGTEPKPTSPLYAGPIRLTNTTTINATEFAGPTQVGTARATFKRLTPLEPVEPAGLKPGLLVELHAGHYQFYNSANLNSRPAATEVAKDVAAAMELGLRLVGPKQTWRYDLLRVSGYLHVPTDGIYEFSTTSGEYSALSVGNQTLVDTFDFKHATIARRGRLALRVGKHSLVILYGSKSEHRGKIDLVVTYEGPGITRQPLPAAALFY